MKITGPKTVFSRAFSMLVLTGLTTQLTILLFVQGPPPPPGTSSLFFHNLHRYVQLIAGELARDPSEESARRLLSGTGLEARRLDSGDWSLTIKPPMEQGPMAGSPPRRIEKIPVDKDGRLSFQVPVATPNGRMVVSFVGPQGPWSREKSILVPALLTIVFTIFIAAAIVLRRILHPIRSLSQAMERIEAGDVSVSLPSDGKDELGRLSQTFNRMAASIHFLIEDREQLFTELSHEFRAPVARALMANAMVESPRLRNEIEKDLKELDSLIHALLTASRLEAGSATETREQVLVSELIDEVCELFSEESARIEVAVPDAELLCEADRRSLRMLLRNLVENALKYSDKSRPVRLTAEAREDRIYFAVRDEGKGIPREELSRIFERFFRGDDRDKTSRPGFGLGLALCRRIARAHGGDLKVESVEGRGTTIVAWFPVTAQRSPSLPNSRRAA